LSKGKAKKELYISENILKIKKNLPSFKIS
jgi:hypothetical protein